MDAGCGEGHLIERMHERYPNHHYCGIDLFSSEVEATRRKCPYARVHQLDLSEESQRYNTELDVITCTGVLEHIPKYQKAIANMETMLKKGGLMIITFPNEPVWMFCRFLLGKRPVKIVDHFHSFNPNIIDISSDSKLTKKINLPASVLPFPLSLESIMVFRK